MGGREALEEGRRKILSGFGTLLLLVVLAHISLARAAEQGRIFLTKGEILEGARRERQVVVTPGFDQENFSLMKEAFERRHPFLKADLRVVTGTAGSQRFHFDLASGVADVDVFSPSLDRWADYEKYHVIAKYDLGRMVRAGELKIHPDMIDDGAPTPGLFADFGSRIDVILYNTKLVRPEEAPTGWESCTDPKWRGKFSADTRPHGLLYLVAAWPEERVLAFARRLKENNPIWVRGQTATITRLAAGEIQWMCGAYLHSAIRILRKDPSLPMKVVFPNPTIIVMGEPEAIYARARHPHAGLLWMEWVASQEAQEVLSKTDPGKASFLVEGTLPNRLIQDAKVKTVLCGGKCKARAAGLEKSLVQALGFPTVKGR